MTNDEKKELANYRIAKAKETLTEVELPADNERWNTAVNRLYYACFYATTALLAQHGIFCYYIKQISD